MEIPIHAATRLRTTCLRSLAGALTAFACLSPATLLRAQPDPSDLLLRVRDRVLNTADRLPRYLCTQTVDRRQYEPAGIRPIPDCETTERDRGKQFPLLLTTADRLRLDVGVAQGQEAYSWVGENRFGDRTLFEIVKEGALSTGNFHGFLGLVFRVDNADFSFVGEKAEDGRKLMEYRFEVPMGQSHYEFGSDGHPDATAYEGTLTADPETADLVELTVRTRNLSTKTGACEVATSMKYSGWQVNGATFLLPERTRMDIRMVNGVEFRNDSVYAGCREFLGESMLRFEGPGERESVPSKAGKAPGAAAVPAGLPFTLQLAQDIAVATAAAGDPVKAALATDLADGRKILAAKGTALTCRIQRIRRFYNVHDRIEIGAFEPAARVEIVLQLESLASSAGPQPITARIARSAPQPNRPGALAQRGLNLGPLAALGANLWFARFEDAKDDFVIPIGMASDWMTAR